MIKAVYIGEDGNFLCLSKGDVIYVQDIGCAYIYRDEFDDSYYIEKWEVEVISGE